MKPTLRVVSQALWITSLSCLVALVFNWTRIAPLPWIAEEPYQILKDCPEFSKQATGISLTQFQEDKPKCQIIDARPKSDYVAGHIPSARSIPYDPLEPLDVTIVDELKKLSPAMLLVYGDAEIDSGRLLANELASSGILGVRYLEGGYETWTQAKLETTSGELR